MTRRNARELVMQMIYEGNFHDESERERIIYDKIKELDTEEKKPGKGMTEFMESRYLGIYEHLKEIDELI